MNRVSFDVVDRLLSYSAETGELRWKHTGAMAGRVNHDGYVQVSIKGKRYQAHRLCWMLANGAFPEGEIDHINHDKEDNRLANLRVVSGKENKRNRPRPKNNTSGFTGVVWHKKHKKWQAQIKVDGSCKYLGLFYSLEDAVLARKSAEVDFDFHENHGE